MIKIPQDILTTEELERISGMKEQDINIEIPRVYLEKESLTLVVGVKLNFVIPRIHEKRMRDRILKKVGQAKDVRFRYAYQASEAPAVKKASDKSKGSKKPNVSGGVLYGTYISGDPIPIEEIYGKVGERGQVVIRGELFSLDSRAIKNGKLLVTMEITDKERATCCKAFMKTEDFELLEENVSLGDWLKISGNVEFDTFENEVGIMARSINQSSKPERKDEHPGEKRVELHVHTKMSDNDGFNEIAELVDQAAAWGQKAVAITDHGVVQAFPDAANRAAKLRGKGKDIKIIYGMEGYLYPDEDAMLPDGTIDIKKNRTYHIILLAKNLTGLRNLYKMVSYSHVDYFYKKPRLPRSVLQQHREGIIVGSACEAGELYQALLNGKSDETIAKIVDFYDYLEIQPLGNNAFMIDSDKVSAINSMEDVKDMNRKIVRLGEQFHKPVVATCDVHFMDPDDEVYRRIIMAGKGFSDADQQAPLYLRTTEEMLEEFAYLGSEKAYEVVIANTNKIANMIEKISPVRPDKCPPVIENSDQLLTDICYTKAYSMYGNPLPEIVEERLKRELHSIISNGFAVMYIIAQKLVWKSNEDGYLVGSRGSVGSSFVATMSGITEVNPLSPHYYCQKCHYSDFTSDEVRKYAGGCGHDMPDKLCPVCGEKLIKDGFDIPFETFLGFKGNKEPDIDLNFSGDYQSKAHKYTEVIFGQGQTFRAGTIAALADKTAYGYVKNYYEERGDRKRNCEIDRIVQGCTGIRRSTGQHPGGIVVLPHGEDINSFTPIQHPANDMTTDIITTHFDYHSIDHNLLKLDILGHDDPTMIKTLEELINSDSMDTGYDGVNRIFKATDIPLDDPGVMSLFAGTEALGIKPEDIDGCPVGCLGIPEFGTDFVIQMVVDTKPKTLSDLIRISGLSHGTDVWLNNAQTLIEEGKATISTAICTRDDIMTYLINKGLDSEESFTIMERVRKGTVAKGKCKEWPEFKKDMLEHDVPEWYIWSCEKIKYMFPKAHAAAYVMMAYRIAYCKLNYPLAYYAAYFGIRASAFSYELMGQGKDKLLYHMKEYKRRAELNQLSKKDQDTLKDMKNVLEMYARGFEFLPIDIYESAATKFKIVDGKLLPPLNTIEGMGDKAAEAVEIASKNGPYLSKDDFRQRTKVSKTVIDLMDEMGLLGDLPETNQLSLFDFT